MKLTLLGTGIPSADPARRGPSQVLQVGGDLILVDCGAGAMHRLLEAGYQRPRLTSIAFTHLHSDHITGLPDLLWAGWVGRWWQQAPVVYGPPGTARFVERLVSAFEYDITVRRDARFGEKLLLEALMPRVQEIEEGWSSERNGWRLEAFRVDHEPVDQAFGFRFDEDSASVVISGDTRPSENLVRHAQGAGVLVHEVYGSGLRKAATLEKDPAIAERLRTIMSYHTPSDEVGRIAAHAGVSHLVLSHLVLRETTPAQLLSEAQAGFTGKVTVGEDLMSFEL